MFEILEGPKPVHQLSWTSFEKAFQMPCRPKKQNDTIETSPWGKKKSIQSVNKSFRSLLQIDIFSPLVAKKSLGFGEYHFFLSGTSGHLKVLLINSGLCFDYKVTHQIHPILN